MIVMHTDLSQLSGGKVSQVFEFEVLVFAPRDRHPSLVSCFCFDDVFYLTHQRFHVYEE